MKTLLFLLIVNLFWPPQDQAERLFDNAVTFMNAGKYKEALTDFDTIINSFGDTPWAPRALLEVGTYYLNVENNLERALEYMNRLQNSYAASPQAPAAYYYRALITARTGNTPADLESATADLLRMNNLFPDNPWRGDALFLFGTLTLRLDNFKQSLSYFQRLEFSDPHNSRLQDAWQLSALAAYLDGIPKQTALILARLQARFPNTVGAETAAAKLRLLDRFTGTPTYTLDKTFFGSTPKTFDDPELMAAAADGTLAVQTNKSYRLIPLAEPGKGRAVPSGDLEAFGFGPKGELLFVYPNRVVSEDGTLSFKDLSINGARLEEIKGAAIDGYGRLYVSDGKLRDVAVFDRDGRAIKTLGVAKARQPVAYRNSVLVLNGDGSGFRKFDAALNNVTGPGQNLRNIVAFCYDAFGTLYVLHDKGSHVTLLDGAGETLAQFSLKNGSYPLKQAQGLAVDATGALYLSDRRGGAVYRFQ